MLIGVQLRVVRVVVPIAERCAAALKHVRGISTTYCMVAWSPDVPQTLRHKWTSVSPVWLQSAALRR